MNHPWIDLTIPIRPAMPIWPGNPAMTLERRQCLQHGDVCNVSHLSLGTHTGTHIDGLNHFVKGAPGIDQMPMELMTGPAKVIEIANPMQISARELRESAIIRGDRVLFKTRNSNGLHDRDDFERDFVHLSVDAAQYLAEVGVALIGVDYLSVGGFEGNVVDVHHALLESGIWCVEGLDMSQLLAGSYEFHCLPIRLVDGDGGLARAIARRIDL